MSARWPARDFAAVRIEGGQDDRARRVVPDQLDAGACSSARMFRPSRPMIRPSCRRSADRRRDGGSMACSGAALEASAMICGRAARRFSRLGSRRFTRCGVAARVSLVCCQSSSRASSAVRPATRCNSRWRSASTGRSAGLPLRCVWSSARALSRARRSRSRRSLSDRRSASARVFSRGRARAHDFVLARARLRFGVRHQRVRLLARSIWASFLMDPRRARPADGAAG